MSEKGIGVVKTKHNETRDGNVEGADVVDKVQCHRNETKQKTTARTKSIW